ncbi:uncharacterized protein LOC118506058 [Anopheles stephensi]|uniref:uncharacterized protein LOC118506058 n=1 Tax=Anopheles stephensi TaxID=30069 RepID=UPI001658806E|nr:uncharacterized protein LOC118506058 [Anopheles stephensi]XP_035898594.1 uncharacterized protein LOC118506058 [Anopheles stephensi]
MDNLKHGIDGDDTPKRGSFLAPSGSESSSQQTATSAEPLSVNVSSGKGRSTLHGDSYQLRLGLVILLRAFRAYQEDCTFEFEIAMEDPAGKDFDDIMYHFSSPRLPSGTVSVQAKHKRDGKKSMLTEGMLLAPANCTSSSFSIPKYFISFLQVDQHLKTNTHTYVLCTNGTLDEGLEDRLMVRRNCAHDGLQFCVDIGASCYQINPTAARKKLEKRLLDSCALELGKVLAADVWNGTEITFSNPMYNTFASLLRECVQSLESEKNEPSCFKLSEAFFEPPTTSSAIASVRAGFEKAYRRIANAAGSDIRAVLNEVVLKIDGTTLSTVLAEANPLERTLKKFYDSFVLVCNSLHEEDMYGRAVELLPNWCNGAVVVDSLHLQMFNAIKSERPVPINVNRLQQWFRATGVTPSIAQLMYSSKEYIEPLRLKYPHIEIAPDRLSCSTLAKFLQRDGGCGVYEFGSSLGSKLGSLVVAQTLPLLQYEALFVDGTNCRELRNANEALPALLSYLKDVNHPTIKVVLIVGKQSRGLIANSKELSERFNQKIIVIEETAPDSSSTARTSSGESYCVDDLAPEALRRVFEAHEHVTLFGTVTPLSRIVHPSDELSLLVDVLDEVGMLRAGDHNVNERNYDEIKRWYIQRTFEPLDDSPVEQENVAQHISRHRNVFAYSAQDDVPFAQMAKYVDNHEASTSSEVARVLGTYEEDVDSPSFPPAPDDSGAKVCIFLNEAGHGKTCFFTWLAWRLAKQSPTRYVVKLNAMEYSTDFDRLDGSGRDVPGLDDTVLARLLYRLVHLALFVPSVHRQTIEETDLRREEADRCAALLTVAGGRIILDELKAQLLPASQLIELRLFREKFNEQQLILLLDGFDETAPYYKAVVMSCMARFARLAGVRRIYLSSRPCDFEREFKHTFPDCSIKRLRPFSRANIVLSLHKFLLNNVAGYRRCDTAHSTHVLTVLYVIIVEALGDLATVPLLLHMVQVTLLPVIVEHTNFELRTISQRMLAGAKLDTLQLVEHFIERKIELLMTVKSGTSNSAAMTAAAKARHLSYSKTIKERHALLAVCAIFDRSSRERLLSRPEQDSVSRLIEEVIRGEEKTGIVDGIRDGVPQFAHRLFAEYFAACWLNQNRARFKHERVFQSQAVWTPSLEKMRDFLNRMILMESAGCELHWTLVNKSMGAFRALLHNAPPAAMLTTKDCAGRLPLHLVAKSGNSASELLESMPAELVNATDDLFGWTALDYAFLLQDGFALRDLLAWGARLNFDILLQQLYSNDAENVFYCGAIYAYFLRRFANPPELAEEMCARVVKHLIQVRKLDIYARRQKFESLSVLEFSTAWNLRDMFHQLVTQSGPPAQVLRGVVDRLFQLAFERKAHDIIDYLADHCRFPLPSITDGRSVVASARRAMENNQLARFKLLFQQLCTRYRVATVEENDIVDEEAAMDADGGEQEAIEIELRPGACCVSSKKNVGLSLPDRPLSADLDTDNRDEIVVEWLLATAKHIGNVPIASYILQKAKLAVTNRLIVTVMRLFPQSSRDFCHRKSVPAYRYLLSKTLDLHSVDEEGRNLFHMTAQNGCFYMLPCLIATGFDPRQINVRNRWNGFHYLMSSADMFGWRACKALAFFQRRSAPVDGFDTLSTEGESVFDVAIANSAWPAAQMLVQAQYSSLSCGEKVDAMVRFIGGMLRKHGAERTLEFLFFSRVHSLPNAFVADQMWYAVYSFLIKQIPLV